MGRHAEATQAAYCIRDSTTNLLTPLSLYFPLIAAFWAAGLPPGIGAHYLYP